MEARTLGDKGIPAVMQDDTETAKLYAELAEKVIEAFAAVSQS